MSCGKLHNILIVENLFGMGGLEKKLYEMVRRFDANHFRMKVCCLKRGGYFKKPFMDLGVPFHDDLMQHKYDVFAFRRFLKILEDEDIDLVYTTPHPNAIVFCHLARALGKVKRYVLSIHGSGNPDGGKVFPSYQKAFLGRVDRFIAVANVHKRYLVDREGLDAGKIDVIHNGVDIDLYRPSAQNGELRHQLGVDDGDRVITAIATLIPYKCIDVLLATLSGMLRDRGGVKIVIVGDGPERGNLEQLTRELRIEDRVVFAGLRGDVNAVLQQSDMLVLPSRPGPETFPNVILEAMATGLPVVATDVGSVGELVVSGECGYVVPYDDPDVLRQRVEELLDNEERALAFGRKGREIVETQYRLESMVTKREELFRQLLCG